ncbi:MAG: sulfur carrier protein ThiS [Chthoniobacterales bacterium]
MKILLNGNSYTVTSSSHVQELVKELDLHENTVLIEHNENALLRSEWITAILHEGDRIEVLRVVAGG